MKYLFLLIVAGVAAYYGYTQYYSNPAFMGNLHLPESVAWRELDESPTNQGYIVVNAIDGNKWRMEAIGNAGRVVVAVYDGSTFVATPMAAGLSAEGMDPKPSVRAIYDGLRKAHYAGVEVMDGKLCLHYTQKKNGQVTHAWIDRETQFPVRFTGVAPGGNAIDQHYAMLPLDVKGSAPRIFNVRGSTALFTDYLRK